MKGSCTVTTHTVGGSWEPSIETTTAEPAQGPNIARSRDASTPTARRTEAALKDVASC